METQNENICRNCGTVITENFCGSCGQKKYKRIDRKYLIDEFQYSLVHTNKGFFYTLKNLIKNPGRTAREYVEGKRANHYKPILLAFVLCGFSLLVTHYLIDVDKLYDDLYKNMDANAQMGRKISEFGMKWFSFLMMALLPVFALTSYLSFKSYGQNYYEHAIMNSYVMSLYICASLVIITPLYFLFPAKFVYISMLNLVLTPVLLYWFFRGFYPKQDSMAIIARILMMILMIFGAYVIVSIAVAIGYMIFNPEYLEQFRPKKIK